jgi:hypothetical protein
MAGPSLDRGKISVRVTGGIPIFLSLRCPPGGRCSHKARIELVRFQPERPICTYTKEGGAVNSPNSFTESSMFNKAENHKRYMKDVWYPANKRKHQKMVSCRRIAIRKFIQDIKKSSKCCRCLETDSRCLDFHHVGKKSVAIASLPNKGWSWDRIKKEIAKCVLLCANCHRKEHIEEF